jgi:drug/metabolite transporter (DMT)-like permease
VLAAVMWARAISVLALLAAVASARPALDGARGRFHALIAIGLLDGGATALYTLATTEALLSLVAVVSSLYPIVTVILARLLLREEIRPIQAGGVLLALTGVVLLAA